MNELIVEMLEDLFLEAQPPHVSDEEWDAIGASLTLDAALAITTNVVSKMLREYCAANGEVDLCLN